METGRSWAGSVGVAVGQGIVVETRLVWSSDSVVRLEMDTPLCQIEFAATVAGIESLSQYDDCIRSVEVVSLAPDADGHLLRVTVAAAEDGLAFAEWSVVSGDADLGQPSLTVG